MDVERTMSMMELYSREQQVAGSLVATKIKCTIRTSSISHFTALVYVPLCTTLKLSRPSLSDIPASKCSSGNVHIATLTRSRAYPVMPGSEPLMNSVCCALPLAVRPRHVRDSDQNIASGGTCKDHARTLTFEHRSPREDALAT